ncbi:MAG: phage tail sheath C-terminal domain-containing protein [Cyclobacteriaceae bacterium]
MLNLKTPGVYIQEISTLPASVAPVATAIPAFVGYTQKRELNGEILDDYYPVRITSMLEYEEVFGLAFDENYNVKLEDDGDNVKISFDASYKASDYILYYAMDMYFSNGGGPCYVISAGLYDYDTPNISNTNLQSGINEIMQEDEPTLIVVPEIAKLNTTGQRKALNDSILTQCNTLQDRFGILDVKVDHTKTVKADGDFFRNEVGSDNLKYGAAYYPSLHTILPKYYEQRSVNIVDARSIPVYDNESLDVVQYGTGSDASKASATITFNSRFKGLLNHTITIGDEAFIFKATGSATEIEIGETAAETAANFAAFVNDSNNKSAVPEKAVTVSLDGTTATITADAEGVDGNDILIEYTGTSGIRVSGKSLEGGSKEDMSPDLALYNQIKTFLDTNLVTLPASSAVAGVFARVDRDRGVWKAPANVSINKVSNPSVLVSAEEQGSLNIDANTGKSINVIRNFQGRGVLIWGSRTLAGNDNEWRYVPVRRLFIFIEESIKKATEPTVFEPNDANTWAKLKSMIENFLTSLWREGALAGAAPQDAFFVKIGLGETMSSLDILEGRLNVEIGIAAVRPAEFIVLKFSHKLQES